jgi:hypothetical protein
MITRSIKDIVIIVIIGAIKIPKILSFRLKLHTERPSHKVNFFSNSRHFIGDN